MSTAAARTPAAPAAPNRWWILPATLVGLIVVAWLVLAGLPFGGDRRDVLRQQPRPAAEVVTEGTPPPQSATILEAPGTGAGSAATATAQTERSRSQPAPVTNVPAPVARTRSAPNQQQRPAAAVAPTRTERSEITAAEAEATLHAYVARTNYYQVPADCLQIQNGGYKNVGYTLDLWDRCGTAGSRRLGRWRVDAKTREVYRQREDGRYLRP